MKLRNKKTGEIVDHIWWDSEIEQLCVNGERMKFYDSLAELNEEWEDVEEPKEHWTIDPMNENYIDDGRYTAPDELGRYEELGLKFNTEEEAKKAVEKLKAWKRLKDKGFRFIDHIDRDSGQGMARYEWDGYVNGEDLDLLFGGEE